MVNVLSLFMFLLDPRQCILTLQKNLQHQQQNSEGNSEESPISKAYRYIKIDEIENTYSTQKGCKCWANISIDMESKHGNGFEFGSSLELFLWSSLKAPSTSRRFLMLSEDNLLMLLCVRPLEDITSLLFILYIFFKKMLQSYFKFQIWQHM